MRIHFFEFLGPKNAFNFIVLLFGFAYFSQVTVCKNTQILKLFNVKKSVYLIFAKIGFP